MSQVEKKTRVPYVVVVAVDASAAHVGNQLPSERNFLLVNSQGTDLLQHFKSRVVVSPVNRDSKLQDKIHVDDIIGIKRLFFVRAGNDVLQFVASVPSIKVIVNFAYSPQREPVKNLLVKP